MYRIDWMQQLGKIADTLLSLILFQWSFSSGFSWTWRSIFCGSSSCTCPASSGIGLDDRTWHSCYCPSGGSTICTWTWHSAFLSSVCTGIYFFAPGPCLDLAEYYLMLASDPEPYRDPWETEARPRQQSPCQRGSFGAHAQKWCSAGISALATYPQVGYPMSLFDQAHLSRLVDPLEAKGYSCHFHQCNQQC